jgi:HPt (histidine-containing phosphotransfer) domain-containing protein
MTIQELRDYGANVDEGLARCFGKEDFYLRMVGLLAKEPSFEKLQTALADGNLKEAFDAAHSLKGVLGNLALTPLFNPVNEMTELLRKETPMDYSSLLTTILQEKKRLFGN